MTTPRRLSVIDWSALSRVVGDDAALRDRLLTSFERESARDLEKLEAALDARQFEAARAVAHQLSGAARIVGALSLADAARALEVGGYDDASEVAARRTELRAQLALAHERIRAR